MSDILKVLIVDDTITYRSILRSIIEKRENTEVVDTAANGKIALDKLKNIAVDLVLLDIEMPEMDGLETLQNIRRQYPNTGVIMVSSMNRGSADITIKALEFGALDFIPKPDNNSLKESVDSLEKSFDQFFEHFYLRRARKANNSTPHTPPIPNRPGTIPAATSAPASHKTASKIDLIVIGSSTGGPNALGTVLTELTAKINVPILIVQHMPPIFTTSLANSLNKKCELTVKEAEEKDVIEKNTVYIAPGGRHMTVSKNEENHTHITLLDTPPEHSCRPAVDVLFRSVAETYAGNILSVILTGMGSDGALGVKALKAVGCHSIAQSEKTCVVYGMPRAVVEMQLADEIVDLKDMASRILYHASKK